MLEEKGGGFGTMTRFAPAITLGLSAVVMAESARAQDPNYLAAKRHFESVDLKSQVEFQVVMTAAGLFASVQTDDYGAAMHRSIKEFQESRGGRGTSTRSAPRSSRRWPEPHSGQALYSSSQWQNGAPYRRSVFSSPSGVIFEITPLANE